MKTSTVRILGIYYIYVEKEKHSSFRFYAQGTLQQLHRYNCLSTTGHKQERPNKCRFKLILYTIPSYYKVCLTGVGSVKRQWTSDNETPIKRQEVNVPTYIDSTRECSPQKHEKTHSTTLLPRKQEVKQSTPEQSPLTTAITGQVQSKALDLQSCIFCALKDRHSQLWQWEIASSTGWTETTSSEDQCFQMQ